MPRDILATAARALETIIADVATDPRKLKPGEACRLLNSTPLGAVIDDRRLRAHRTRAGSRIGDGKTIDLFRYTAWLYAQHAANVAGAESYTAKAAGTPPGVAGPPSGVPGARFPTRGIRLADTVRPSDPAEEINSERSRDAARKAEKRKAGRILEIPACADPARRQRLEADVFAWLKFYFEDIFEHDFPEQQRTMIAALLTALSEGGDQAIAASRGEGKSTTAECVLIYCVLTGRIKFAIIFAGTGEDAKANLAAIKERLEDNERLLADYPEVCVPIAALEGVPQKAHSMICRGVRPDNGKPFGPESCRFTWCGKQIILPRVPGSRAAGAVIATRGLDAAVRGVKVGGKSLRPDLVVIDDPDTDETVNNLEEQGVKLEKKIERNIGGLGGQKRPLARVMLTTVQRRGCVSDRFTDPKVKQSWRGKRFRFLLARPERMDLWDEYVQLKKADWENAADDKPTKLAEVFYKKQRQAMDAGALVANPWRKPDGQLSALQYYFDFVAKNGPEAAATELDNDPPEEAGPIESGITASRVQKQRSGFPRREIPPGCTLLTMGVDVRKIGLHWVVLAWDLARLLIYVIDHGVFETTGTIYGSDEGLDLAIRRAILGHLEDSRGRYALPIDLTLVDAGWQTADVYAACAEAGLGVMPIMGFGKSAGCVQTSFHEQQRRTIDKKPGDGWFLSRKGTVWLVCADADRWKSFLHDRLMTAAGKPGYLSLFGAASVPGQRMTDDDRAQHSFAHHVTAEVLVEEPVKGILKRYWKTKSPNNHFLDAAAYACCAANMKGFRLASSAAKPTAAIPGGGGPASQPAGSWFASQKGKRG